MEVTWKQVGEEIWEWGVETETWTDVLVPLVSFEDEMQPGSSREQVISINQEGERCVSP